jgi:hypothetical protein
MSTLQRRRSPSNIASNSARPRRIRCAAQRLPNPVGDVRSGSIPVYGVSRSFRFPPKAAFQAFRPSRLANGPPQRIPVLKTNRTLYASSVLPETHANPDSPFFERKNRRRIHMPGKGDGRGGEGGSPSGARAGLVAEGGEGASGAVVAAGMGPGKSMACATGRLPCK